MNACEHCYCTTVQVVVPETTGTIPHERCCNCGHQQRIPTLPFEIQTGVVTSPPFEGSVTMIPLPNS